MTPNLGERHNALRSPISHMSPFYSPTLPSLVTQKSKGFMVREPSEGTQKRASYVLREEPSSFSEFPGEGSTAPKC